MKNILLAFLLSISSLAYSCCHSDVRNIVNSDENYKFDVNGPLSIDIVEKLEMVSINIDDILYDRPFGYQYDKWLNFKETYQVDDCIFHIISDENSWKSLSGREAYILYRNGEIIFTIVTKIS